MIYNLIKYSILALLLFGDCLDTKILATIGREHITESDLSQRIKVLEIISGGHDLKQGGLDDREVLESMIDEKLLMILFRKDLQMAALGNLRREYERLIRDQDSKQQISSDLVPIAAQYIATKRYLQDKLANKVGDINVTQTQINAEITKAFKLYKLQNTKADVSVFRLGHKSEDVLANLDLSQVSCVNPKLYREKPANVADVKVGEAHNPEEIQWDTELKNVALHDLSPDLWDIIMKHEDQEFIVHQDHTKEDVVILRCNNRTDEMSEVSVGVKALAKDMALQQKRLHAVQDIISDLRDRYLTQLVG